MEQLMAIDIKTVGDLRSAVNASNTQQRAFITSKVLTRYTSRLKKFAEEQELKRVILTNIPQYVWEA